MIDLDTVRTDRVLGFRNLTAGEDSWICVIVKEAHLLVGAAKPTATRRLELIVDRRYEGDCLVEESDYAAAARSSCDITVSGTAYNIDSAPSVDTSLTVGSLSRTVRVHGQRVLSVRGGRVEIGEAKPFESAPLSRQNAYGGSLPSRRRRGAFGANARRANPDAQLFYPRNGSGRGFCLSAAAELLDGTLAPSQEDPTDPITSERMLVDDAHDWPRAPLCADYGPVDVDEYPRAQFIRPYALPGGLTTAEAARGWFSGDRWRADAPPDPRLASAAAPGLSGRVVGGQRCVARNLFPAHREVSFRVPSGPRRAEVALPGAGLFSAELELRGLHLRPDEGLLEVTWCGRIPVLFAFPEGMLQSLRVGWD